jgi:hypothetical protein
MLVGMRERCHKENWESEVLREIVRTSVPRNALRLIGG